MVRSCAIVFLLAAFTVAAWAQGGGPALPPPPPAPPAKPPEQAAKPPVALPDMKDPAAVAAAYGLACQNLDGDTALKLIAVTPDKAEMLKGMFAEFAKGPGGMDGKTAVRQFLLVPIFGMGVYTPGKAEVQGNKATVPVTVTATLEQKFVLVKRADGTWGVDLDATSVATTGQPMFFLHEPGMDGGGGPGGPEGATCLSNLRQVGMAALMFAQDHDETLPAADKWTDELVPYLKNQAVFKCPSAKDLDCAYAINAKVAGKSLAQIAEPATTVLFFESTKGKRNSADAMESLVPKGRHNGGNYFTYADGHAMWVPFGQDPALAGGRPGGPGGP